MALLDIVKEGVFLFLELLDSLSQLFVCIWCVTIYLLTLAHFSSFKLRAQILTLFQCLLGPLLSVDQVLLLKGQLAFVVCCLLSLML